MKATLEFDLTDPTDLALYNAASQGMASGAKNMEPAVKEADGGDASEAEAEEQKKAEAAAKRKAAREKKKAEEEAKAKAEAEAKAAEEDDDGFDDLDDEEKTYTQAEVRAALKAYAAKHSKAEAIAILKDAGANSMSELSEEHFQAVMEKVGE